MIDIFVHLGLFEVILTALNLTYMCAKKGEKRRVSFVLSALYVGAVTSLPFLMMKVNVRQVSVGPSKRTTALFSAASLHLLGTSSRRTQVASCRVH